MTELSIEEREPARLSVEERVAAGAAWLDAHRPGWVEHVDLAELDMESCDRCVLGQLFGNYWDARLNDVPPPLFSFEITNYSRAAARLGFSYEQEFADTTDADFEASAGADLDALAAEWRRLIESRRTS